MQSLAIVGNLSYVDRNNTQGCLVITENLRESNDPRDIIRRSMGVHYDIEPTVYTGMYRKSLIVLRRYDGE